MDKHVYRPVPERGTFRSLTGLLSQGTIQDVEDDILEMETLISQFSQFLPHSPLDNRRQTVVNIDDDNIEVHQIGEDTTTFMNDVLPSDLQQQTSKQVQSGRSDHVIHPQTKTRFRWTVTDTIILIEAKCLKKDLQTTGGIKRRTLSSMEKWRAIEKYCFDNGVQRSANQCRDRWKHIQPEYKRIRDYEKNIPSGHDSYWNMTTKERVEKKLPSNFVEDIYNAMENNFGNDRSIDPGDIIVDTSSTKYGTFDTSQSLDSNEPVFERAPPEMAHGNENHNPSSTSNETDKQSTGKNRRSISKQAGLKDALLENNKLIISKLELAEQGCMKRHERDTTMFKEKMERDAAMFERKMDKDDQNEQRMIHVEEQKVTVQLELVSTLNRIGQAMFKISETLEKK